MASARRASLRRWRRALSTPDSFLVEPGGGRPDAGRIADASLPAQASHQANYIDVARRAIAARAAAEQAEQPEAQQRKGAKVGEDDAFARPMAAANGRRLPALLAMAGAVLVLGVWQTYRFFDVTPPPPIASAASPVTPGGVSPAPLTKSLSSLAPAAQSPAAQTPAAASTPLPPGGLAGPTTGPGAGAGLGAGQGVDPLAVGSIKPREIQLALLKQMAEKGDSAAQFDMAPASSMGAAWPAIRRRRSAGSKRRRRRGWPRRNSASGAFTKKALA